MDEGLGGLLSRACVCSFYFLSSSSVLRCRTTHVTLDLLLKRCSDSADGEAGSSDDDARD